MTRFAPAVVAAALVMGCAPVTTNDGVVTSGGDLFAPREASVAAANCGGDGDDAARTSCLVSVVAVLLLLRRRQIF